MAKTNSKAANKQAEQVISIQGLHKSFGALEVLKGIDLTVNKGENVAVLGKSGSGKSVLIKIIVGLLKPDSGTLNVLEKEVVAIYPNPATTVITIISSEEIYSVQFIGLDGCVAKSTDGGFSRTINISDLYSGLYIVRVQTNKGLVYSKLRVR